MPWLEPDEHWLAVEAARDIALRRLDRCAAPRAALAALLERKGVEPEVAEESLDKLEAAGIIDDAAYAAMLARTRHAEKGTARRGVAAELRRKGLKERDIQAALDEISDEDELAAAEALVRKKLAQTVGLDPLVRKRRTLAMLARKGYSAGVALEAYRRMTLDVSSASMFELGEINYST